jgi:hypothetical protein
MKQSAFLVLALVIGTIAHPGLTQTPQVRSKPSAKVEKSKAKPAKPPKVKRSEDPKITSTQADATAAAYKKGVQPNTPK